MTLQNGESWRLDYYNLVCYGNTNNTVFRRNSGQGTFNKERVLSEYTSESAKKICEGNFANLAQLPTLFVVECDRKYNSTAPAYVARLANVREERREVAFDYIRLDGRITSLEAFESIIDIESGSPEMSRTHWAVKEGNLIERLFEFWDKRSGEENPRVFGIDDWPLPKRGHIAVMMPFAAEFNPVHETIRQSCRQAGYNSTRVDEIYGPNVILKDVFTTIETSAMVVCDVTGKNPNVLYEAGLAHARNIKVILVTQRDDDIPSNIQHIKYIKYLPNGEGLEKLKAELYEFIVAG